MDPFNTYTRKCGSCFGFKKLRGGKQNRRERTFTCAECLERGSRDELERQLRSLGSPANA
jgi:hypothetical protein